MGVNYNGFKNYQKNKDNRSPRTLSAGTPEWARSDARPAGAVVYHAIYGKGIMVSENKQYASVVFGDGEERTMAPAFLYNNPATPSTAESNGYND